MKTAESTITSDAITKSQILATSFVIFKSIHFEVSFAQGIDLLNAIITNKANNIATNISLIQSIPKRTINFQEVISILMKANNATHRNR
ncbi:hypothetical protein J6T66_03655 [bacterium]|nr:hypothetical protein [bacterium]